VVSRRAYDWMYRRGAPWEGGPRQELVDLVQGGRLSPSSLPPGRAVDLGCGSGANAIFLAEQGFETVGVDFSPVALAKGRAAAQHRRGLRLRFVEADVTATSIEDVDGPFDLVVDYGTLDDLWGRRRQAMARTVERLTRPGGVALLWCFYDEIAWWRRPGGRFPGLRPEVVQQLFSAAFEIERWSQPPEGSGFACLLMTRR
jgi:SAM-dependent methyltransferase